MKIWSSVFWNPAAEAPESPVHLVGRLGGPTLMVLPTAVLLVVGLVIAFMAGPLYDLSERAAADLLDPSGYLQAVLP